MSTTRRQFLKTTAMTGLPAMVPCTVFGAEGKKPPSERVNVGVIACGGRAGVTRDYKRYGKSQVTAVCDPISDRRARFKKQFGNCPDYNDFRELLARKDVDAVHIATGDQWHVPISLAAARAGKDMYTEKPLGVTVEEDLAAREIVKKHKRIFQYGTQNRSMSQVRMGTELVLNGHIGEVKEVYVWCPKGASGGDPTPSPVPEGIDYDMWLGPAKKEPFCNDRVLGRGARKGIYHIYDYAIGFIAGWGAHPMDQLQWWADNAGLTVPVRYEGTGKIPTRGLFDTITHWDMKCTYENGLVLRFLDNQTARKVKIPHIEKVKFGHGTLYVGTKGWVIVSRGSWKVFPESLYKVARDPGKKRLMVSGSQTRNFIDSVLARKQPISDLNAAVLSDLICNLSNICIRTKRPINWDHRKETIVGDDEAAKLMSRPMRKPWTL